MKETIAEALKEVKREYNIISLTDGLTLTPKISNIVKYDSENIEKRKKILGLPIGKKYKLKNGSTDSKYYFLLKELSEDYDIIVTGSAALRIYGLLDRYVDGDIDIIATQENIDKMSKKFKEIAYGGYGKSPDVNYNKSFNIKGIVVDVFLENDNKYELVNGVKVHDPFQLMETKLSIGRFKDIDDGRNFIRLLRNNYDLD